MSTEQPDEMSVPIRLHILPELAEKAGYRDLEAAIQLEAAALQSRLGLDGQPAVEVVPRQAGSESAGSVRFSVGGHPLPMPDDSISRALAYATARHQLPDLEVARAALDASAGEIVEFVRLVFRSTISGDAAALLTRDVAARLRRSLTVFCDGAVLPELDEFRALMASVLRMRIALSDKPAIADVLVEAFAQRRPAEETSEDVIAALRPRELRIQLPTAYLRALSLHATEDDRGALRQMRDGLFYELGVTYPQILLTPNDSLKQRTFQVVINDLPTLPRRGLAPNEVLVSASVDQLSVLGVGAERAIDPVQGREFAVVASDDASGLSGLTTWSPLGYAVLAASADLRVHAGSFLDRSAVEKQLGLVASGFPKLVAVAQEHLPSALLVRVFRSLVDEEISVRNVRLILQALLDFDYVVTDAWRYIVFDSRYPAQRAPKERWLVDPAVWTSSVRSAMKRYISHKYTRGRSTLAVSLVDSDGIEKRLADHEVEGSEAVLAAVSSEEHRAILDAVREEVGVYQRSATPPAILTREDVRPQLRSLIAQAFPRVPVLSYQELSPATNIQPIGRITLSE